MKYLIVSLLVLSSLSLKAQRIEENKIDDFTKTRVTRTSWNYLYKSGGWVPLWLGVRVSKINDTYWLNLKIMNGGHVESILEGAKFMLMLSNDSVVELANSAYAISCTGCGAIGFVGSAGQGLAADFMIRNNDVPSLMNNPIKKVRIYLSDGYEEGALKGALVDLIMDDIKMINNVNSSSK